MSTPSAQLGLLAGAAAAAGWRQRPAHHSREPRAPALRKGQPGCRAEVAGRRTAEPSSRDCGGDLGDEPDASLQERSSLCLLDFLPPAAPYGRPPSLPPSTPTPPCPLLAPPPGEGTLLLGPQPAPHSQPGRRTPLLSPSSSYRVPLGLSIPLRASFPLPHPPSLNGGDHRLFPFLLG